LTSLILVLQPFVLQKKMPEAGIAHSMIEAASVLGTEDIMG